MWKTDSGELSLRSIRGSDCVRPVFLLLSLASFGHSWFGHEIRFRDLAWSPDSRRLCFSAWDGGDVESTDDVVMCAEPDEPVSLRVLTPPNDWIPSHRGDRAAAAGRYGLFLADFAGGSITHLVWSGNPADYWITLQDVAWAPDDGLIAYTVYNDAVYERLLYVFDLSTMSERRLFPEDSTRANELYGYEWEDSGGIVCSALVAGTGPESRVSGFVRIDVASGAKQEMTRAAYRAEHPRQALPQVEVLAQALVRVTRPGQQPQDVALPIEGWVGEPTVAPTGKMLALEVYQNNATSVGLMAGDGSGFRILGPGYSPRWVADGSRLVYLDSGSFGVANAAGTVKKTVVSPQGKLANLTTAPKGRHFLFTIQEGEKSSIAVASSDSPGFRIVARGETARWLDDASGLLYFRDDGIGVVFLSGEEADFVSCTSNGYHPRWVSDAEVLFVAGQGSPTGEDDGPSYGEGSGLWLVDVNSGRMRPVPDDSARSFPQFKPGTGEHLLKSPDGAYVASVDSISIEGRGRGWVDRVFVRDGAGGEKRVLAGPWSNRWLGKEQE